MSKHYDNKFRKVSHILVKIYWKIFPVVNHKCENYRVIDTFSHVIDVWTLDLGRTDKRQSAKKCSEIEVDKMMEMSHYLSFVYD